MLFLDLVQTSHTVAATRSRLAKRHAIADLLRRTDPEDAGLVVSYLAGEPRQRRTGLGWAALSDLPPPAGGPTLTVADVDAALEAIAALSGPGSGRARTEAAAALFATGTADEQVFLRALVLGELRQGALDSIMLDAVAEASGAPVDAVRRAAMLRGATAPVAIAALADGAGALDAFTLSVGRPVRPMLASSAPDVPAALARFGGTVSVDVKLDGIRIQVHRDGDAVRVFTRSLEDITDRLPEVVSAVRAVSADPVILDGEAIALDDTERPRPFQDTSARTASHGSDVAAATRITAYFFDCLHADGRDLIDLPLRDRLEVLDAVLPEDLAVGRLSTGETTSAQAFFTEQVAAGHEGIVVKSPEAPYEAGRRGGGWVKVKPRHTLDLVVLAVEWGSGRRTGLLSNIHLGARDPDGGFVMLGKTFKGMTDATLRWQTERFLELEESRSSQVVRVRPEQVVEIAFDGLQRSTRYAGGVALRFARVVRYRDDKTAAEADTIETVRALTEQPDQAARPPVG